MTFPGALTISRLSTEYIIIPVSANFDGTAVSPTNDVVQFAFTQGYGSTPATWVNGTWDSNAVMGVWYNAKVLVGPGGGTALTAGTYTVWIKVTDNPEVPVRQTGTLVIQ